MMTTTRVMAIGLLLFLSGQAVHAEPIVPPPPETYKVLLHYRIPSGRTERLREYFRLARNLEAIGFQKDPGPTDEPENGTYNLMSGRIAPQRVRRLLSEPRIPSVLLMPPDYVIPADADEPVKVQLRLAQGLSFFRQQLFANQTRYKLRQLGFREFEGYDHENNSRLTGTIPAGVLPDLLFDLRTLPAGWLTPLEPVASLPQPLRSIWPIQVIEVTPEPADFPPRRAWTGQEPPQDQQFLSGDLRALLAAEPNMPQRLEVILSYTPPEDDTSWRDDLQRAAPGLIIEGQLGPLVTVQAKPEQAKTLASLSIVSGVRLPRSGEPPLPSAPQRDDGEDDILRRTGLDRLHALGHVGRGVRLAIIDSDFRGLSAVRDKLPDGTVYLDLTAEHNTDLRPDGFPGDAEILGHGTRCALTAARAAPGSELVLIRLNPTAPYQLNMVARAINGDPVHSYNMDRRAVELQIAGELLRQRRLELLKQRKIILSNFSEDPESAKRRQDYFDEQAKHDADEKEYGQRLQRFVDLQRGVRDLRGVNVVASSLVWNEGHPVDGNSPMSRYFDDRPFQTAFWFQSAGDMRGQTWTGLFQDIDNNGVMEFAPPDAPLPEERWTRELNFLGWQPHGRLVTPDLPAKAMIRVSMQWSEVHDPQAGPPGVDPYHKPLADLRLVIYRQRDPSGKVLRSDDLEVVARSTGTPLRIDNAPTKAVYEQMIEFTTEEPGRYIVQVEGQAPATTRPAGWETVPALQRVWELRPRLFVNVLDAANRSAGRPVFVDYAPAVANIGMPADAHQVITIGAARLDNKPEPATASGPPYNMELLIKPNLLAYDAVPPAAADAPNTGRAASFAAGLTATALSAGMPKAYFVKHVTDNPGTVLLVPSGWVPGR
ncbi:MAG: hypothetical protein ACK4RK_03545 [Gemmataceae bacterium]